MKCFEDNIIAAVGRMAVADMAVANGGRLRSNGTCAGKDVAAAVAVVAGGGECSPATNCGWCCSS